MSKLWQTDGNGLHPLVEKYTVGNDYIMDMELLPYDVESSKAHAAGLLKAGVLSEQEYSQLIDALEEVRSLFKAGEFKIKLSDEDCHTAIENFLTEKLGDTGKKIHTGRSRNDQVLTALRLFCKERLCNVKEGAKRLLSALEVLAKQLTGSVMPGYTHSQKAMPLKCEIWAGSYLCALRDDLLLLDVAFVLNDRSPLGSAAGFGSPIPLDRSATAKALGFSEVEANPLYCQNSRGKVEGATAFALVSVMGTLGKLATDLILFTMNEFQFFELNDQFTTGSSIMPNKKNYDIFEIARASVSVAYSLLWRIQELSKNLISGYNRDYQLLKEPLLKLFSITDETLDVMTLVVGNLKINSDQMQAAISDELYYTERAYELVKRGVPFRDAYMRLKSGRSKQFWKNR